MFNIQVVFLDNSNNGYFLLNSTLIGQRFSIKSLKIKIELQSFTKKSIQIRYKTRLSSIANSDHCFLIDKNLNSSCVSIFNISKIYFLLYVIFFQVHLFDYKSISMNRTRINHLWSYALRGSVTIIIENTTIENFEKKIFRNLRQSLAKIIRKYCSKSQSICLSKDINAIR